MNRLSRYVLLPLLLLSPAFPVLRAQVSNERLLRAGDEPHNWLTYSGTYASQRYSTLTQINPANVKNLEQKWIFQAESLEKFETTPLVVDGIMYITQAPSDALALDAKTGRVFWIYRYYPSPDARPCCGSVNRGLAILGDTLFLATLDAHLVALDAKTGRPIWNTRVASASAGYVLTVAPLVVKDKVIVGVAGGEFGIRGFIAAYDTRTGREAWRFNTIAGPGEPGHETWQGQGDAWEHGGGAIWTTGSYDPALNLTYWGTGNPGPDWNPGQREGDNLYSDSVVALDPDTGKLKWFYQFTPNDPYDYDSTQVPVLVDAAWNGSPRMESQRFLLRSRPREWTVSRGISLRQGELGERARCQRAANSNPSAGQCTDVPRRPGRDELVLAILQSTHRSVLCVGVGGLRKCLREGRTEVRRRAALRRRQTDESNSRRAERALAQARSHQRVDRGRGPRRDYRDRSTHWREEVEIPHDRRHR